MSQRSDTDAKSRNPVAERVIVLDIVGLQPQHLENGLAPNIQQFIDNDSVASLKPPFPAVTVPAQTTLATGQTPAEHGDVANGEYDRDEDMVAFWERDRASRERVWEAASDEANLTTGALFFQHLIGTSADVAVTPSPIEDENNDMIEMNCWTNPDDFYDDLREQYGHFPLHNYWGPAANEASSEWILDAARESIDRHDPDLLWVYVPHLDYDAQRHGPHSEELKEAVATIDDMIGEFLEWLGTTDRWHETVVNLVNEYGFHPVDTPVFPNRALREAELLSVKNDGQSGEEIDLAASQAFAMVDHQIAHVYTDAPDEARRVLEKLHGIDAVLGVDGKQERNLDIPSAGDLVLVANSNAWFQYYWWLDDGSAPYYATDMDIHAKPGFDPCELFFGDTGLASLDPTKVSGSHGRVDEEAYGIYGLGGPAAPELALNTNTVNARDVAPTITDLLGINDSISLSFDRPSLLQ
jgi:predicted AlkP superfamily pyrophosphatase or phosphodiesterase